MALISFNKWKHTPCYQKIEAEGALLVPETVHLCHGSVALAPAEIHNSSLRRDVILAFELVVLSLQVYIDSLLAKTSWIRPAPCTGGK